MVSAHQAEPLKSANQQIKRLRRLIGQRKARSQERAFVVEGPSLVAEALRAKPGAARGPTVESIFIGSDLDLASVAEARRRGLPVHRVASGVLEAVLDPVTPQPVAAIVAATEWTMADLAPDRLVLCLVEARDPGNVGTLVRSAEAAGAAGLVLAGSSVDPTNPKAVRASAGSCLRLPIVIAPDLDLALDELQAQGRTLVATVVDPEAVPYDDVRLVEAAVMLGNEAHGLPERLIACAEIAATIPFAGPTESLNLAIAGSLFCFEALRQERSGLPATRPLKAPDLP